MVPHPLELIDAVFVCEIGAVRTGVEMHQHLRKTIWRRLAEQERADKEHAERSPRSACAGKQSASGASYMSASGRPGLSPLIDQDRSSRRRPHARTQLQDPYFDWLDRCLSGRALSQASALVRVRLPDGSIQKAVEREEVEALLDEGWISTILSEATRFSEWWRSGSGRDRSLG